MNHYEKILTSNTKIAVAYILRSTLYKYANGIFNFSKKFTITVTLKNGLFGTSLFGTVVGITVMPPAVTLDTTILILGLTIAVCLFTIGFLSFPAILIWLLIK